MAVFPAYTHLYRLNAGSRPLWPSQGVSTGVDAGQRVQSLFMAPQVQGSVKATLWVNWLLHRSVLICTRGPECPPALDSWLVSQFYSQGSCRLQREGHCSMISLRFSCRMVSLTAWKTKRMFSVSIAVVKWWKSGFPRFLLLRLNDCTRNAWKEQKQRH